MSQQVAPIRLRAIFAPKSSVCILIRRGGSKLSMLIRWDTKTDKFQTGQWFRGRVDYAYLSVDGKYMAMGIMGAKNTGQKFDWSQHHIVCRPPYTVPLVRIVIGLCCRRIAFDLNNRLHGLDDYDSEDSLTERLAPGPCPLVESNEYYRRAGEEDWLRWDGSYQGHDQQGREILLKDGCVYASKKGQWKLLLDTNSLTREKIDIPDWARDW
ncbi:MAG: hypothetical protein K8R88_03195 [Armatimonadetes bacterium]|nr:hypothetical protein [Armatimonadota bacterium]